MATKKIKELENKQKLSLEEMYKDVFITPYIENPSNEGESLEQPSFYKVVQTVTTYGLTKDLSNA